MKRTRLSKQTRKARPIAEREKQLVYSFSFFPEEIKQVIFSLVPSEPLLRLLSVCIFYNRYFLAIIIIILLIE